MPSYDVELYELHATIYHVENAEDEADAIAKALNGEGRCEDNCTDFLEIADEYGMPADENRDIAKKLGKLQVIQPSSEIINGVRGVEETDPDGEGF